MGCHDCGLDLLVDGFEARPLKARADQQEGRTVSGLFCPECADRYDHFSAGAGQSEPCARCGAQVPTGELRLRSLSKSEVAGAVVLSQTRFEKVCPACAAEGDGGGATLLLVAVVGACVLAVVLAYILFEEIGMLVAGGLGLVVLAAYVVMKRRSRQEASGKDQWGCSRCGSVNPSGSRTCKSCGLEV
jgi:hypothetical protein